MRLPAGRQGFRNIETSIHSIFCKACDCPLRPNRSIIQKSIEADQGLFRCHSTILFDELSPSFNNAQNVKEWEKIEHYYGKMEKNRRLPIF